MPFLNDMFPESAEKLTTEEVDAINDFSRKTESFWESQLSVLMKRFNEVNCELEQSKAQNEEKSRENREMRDELFKSDMRLEQLRGKYDESLAAIQQQQEEYNDLTQQSEALEKYKAKSKKYKSLSREYEEEIETLREQVKQLNVQKEQNIQLARNLYTNLGGKLEGTGGFNCPVCNQHFQGRQAMKKHADREHPNYIGSFP